MAMVAQLWSLNGLATELGVDRRRIGNALSTVPPDGELRGRPAYRIKTAISAVYLSHGGDGSSEGHDFEAERARKTKEEADKLEMENATRRGELLPRGEVDDAVIGAFARVRARLLGVPPKVAPLVAPMDEPGECEAAVRSAIYDCLLELSETNVASLCGNDSEMVADTGPATGVDG